MKRLALATALILGLTAAPALAGPPPGDWTFVHRDAFRHYACKTRGSDPDRWRIRTASWVNGHQDAVDQGIGVYAALARGGNESIARQRTSVDWEDGYIRMQLRGALASDRLWLQGAYYGPTKPWSDGMSVRRLTRC